eukprot:CAMPEP_0115001020 /NCGR_PEP_ID=MMETSP0216-20121206/17116_1 /TAXON_ID=223996 /ORGANISM="Protocruzia adherens, Strain Boccale" /LENGTH=90 /DNA_ID=CAMNT_0002366253 /DNA_START=13 /DNA_END=281 /DNA_ORIENTATION=-
MARVHISLQQFQEAKGLLETSKIMFEQILGSEHPNYMGCLTVLANVHATLGETEEVTKILKQVCKIRAKTHGDDHEEVAFGYFDLGKFLA